MSYFDIINFFGHLPENIVLQVPWVPVFVLIAPSLPPILKFSSPVSSLIFPPSLPHLPLLPSLPPTSSPATSLPTTRSLLPHLPLLPSLPLILPWPLLLSSSPCRAARAHSWGGKSGKEMLDTWTAAEDEKENCQDDENDESDNSSPEQATSPAGLPPTSGKSTDQAITWEQKSNPNQNFEQKGLHTWG